MSYVSPFDPRAAAAEPLAKRPSTLAGARIALLDISKARGDEFLDRIEELVLELGATTWRTRKPTFSRAAPREVIEQVAIHGDLAIEGLAD